MKCEKCGTEIVGNILRWTEGTKVYKALCWPCKKPMMDACLPRIFANLKAELESPGMQKALAKMLDN